MLNYLFLLLLLLADVQSYDYTMVVPKEFRVGTTNNVILNLHGYQGTAHVKAWLQKLPGRSPIARKPLFQVPNVNEPISLDFLVLKRMFPNRKPWRPTYVEVNIQVTQSSFNFNKKFQVLLNFTSGYLFLTTNRPVYKPADKVKVTVAIMDQKLLPDHSNDVQVVIKTPVKSGKLSLMKEEGKMKKEKFLSFEFPLASEPPLGIWFVEASVKSLGIKQESTFKVDKYVLPTFQVQVVPDKPYILPRDTNVVGAIRAEYSYGEKVSGSYFLNAELHRPGSQAVRIYKKPPTFDREAYITNGNERFNIDLNICLPNGVTVQQLIAERATLSIKASVTGLYDSASESAEAKVLHFTNSPYRINTGRSALYFVPGLIYKLKVDVVDTVSGHPVSDILVTYTAGNRNGPIKRSNNKGQVDFDIDGTGNDQNLVISVKTQQGGLEAGEQATAQITAKRTEGSRHMSMSLPNHIIVGQPISVVFRFEPVVNQGEIRYFVVSGGQVVSWKTERIMHSGDLSVDIPITQRMVPSARLVAYYLSGTTLVANSVWFTVESQCSGKQLKINLPERVLPEKLVKLKFIGNPSDVIHYSAVDRAAYFIYNGSRLTRNDLWHKIEEYDTACSREGGRNGKNVFEEAGLFIVGKHLPVKKYSPPVCPQNPARKKRQAFLRGRSNNLLKDCEADGRNPSVLNENCLERSKRVEGLHGADCARLFRQSCVAAAIIYARYGERSGSHVFSKEEKVTRKNFMENWLWDTAILGNDGKYETERYAPGSITTFEVGAFSYSQKASSHNGFCIAKTEHIKVFKKFFIQLHLPYSLRVFEQTTIRFSVFNYIDDDYENIPVTVTLSDNLCSSDLSTMVVDVLAKSAATSYFTILPISPGEANVRLNVGFDTIEKTLNIEPRGRVGESYETFILDPSIGITNFQFQFPTSSDNVEPESRSCTIYAYTKPMGPVAGPDPITQKYTTLKNLVNVPGGCGEQNMKLIAPGVYVYKYRKATDQAFDGGQEWEQIVDYIKQAFQIELGFRSKKVAQRAWAVYADHHPSLWLNAFVDRVFTEAQDIVSLEKTAICNSLAWILDAEQKADGRFHEKKPVYHREMDGLVDGDIAMTAYVSVAIRETAKVCTNFDAQVTATLEKAFNYLGQQSLSNNPYVLALTTYALAFNKARRQQALEWNNRLMNLAQVQPNKIWWNSNNGNAGQVETTAYALLAQVKLYEDGANSAIMQRMKKIALWLMTKRNSFGGYHSTQDTVVALQAIAEYMTWIYTYDVSPPPTNLRVRLMSDVPGSSWFGNSGTEEIELSDEDSTLAYSLKVPSKVFRGNIAMTVTGQGIGSMSYRCTWRETQSSLGCFFSIEATIGEQQGDFYIMKVNVSKPNAPPANISIIEVVLLSGFEADHNSIKNLVKENVVDGLVDRYEVTNNTILFYISEISQHSRVLGFKVKQIAPISNPQPASVKVYDFYNPDISCTEFYSLGGDTSLSLACSEDRTLCRCAQGGCPVCRNFSTIASDTEIPAEAQSIFTSDYRKTCFGLSCFNSRRYACQNSEYLVQVRVLAVMERSNMVEFNATILDAPKKSSIDDVQRDAVRTFQLRKECFDQCQNEQMMRIKTGQELLIFGNEPIVTTAEDGETKVLNYLNSNARIERYCHKCRKLSKWYRKKNIKCDRAKGNKLEKCKKLNVYDYQRWLMSDMHRGCN